MDRPKWEVADVFRRYGEVYRDKHGASMSTGQRRVMTAIELCRTAALGGQIEQCDQCGQQRICYRPCGNRHCPKCQSLARAEWIEDRQAELLNCEYFHVVFTVPDKIAAIAHQNKEVVYNILFQATAETLRTISRRSETPRRGDWLLRCPAQLGEQLDASSAPALRRPRRWDLARRRPLGLLQAGLLPLRTRAVSTISSSVSGASPKRLRLKETKILLRPGEVPRSPRVSQLPVPTKQIGVGCLCQTALRGTRKGTRLCRPLYPSRSHLEQPLAGHRRRSSELPIQGL